jgi:hypothetical protein
MRPIRALLLATVAAIGLALPAGARADVLWDQFDPAGSGSYDAQLLQPPLSQFSQELADDFLATPPSAQHWSITEVDVHGVNLNMNAQPDFVRVAFYANNGTLPANAPFVEETNLTPLTGLDTGNFTIALTPPVDLAAGTYWVAVQAVGQSGFWQWTARTGQNLHMAAIRESGGHGYTCPSWESLASCFGTVSEPDMSYRLVGSVVGGSGGGAPPGAGPPADKTPPVLSATAPKTESIKHGFVTITDTTNEPATDTATGTLNVSGAAKVYKLRSTSKAHPAGAVKLRLKVPKKALKAIRHRRKAVARVNVVSQDVAGNSTTRALRIKVKP